MVGMTQNLDLNNGDFVNCLNKVCLVTLSPEIWMNDNVVHLEGLRVQGLLLPVLGVVLAEDHRDLVQLGPMDTVGGRSDVPENKYSLI